MSNAALPRPSRLGVTRSRSVRHVPGFASLASFASSASRKRCRAMQSDAIPPIPDDANQWSDDAKYDAKLRPPWLAEHETIPAKRGRCIAAPRATGPTWRPRTEPPSQNTHKPQPSFFLLRHVMTTSEDHQGRKIPLRALASAFPPNAAKRPLSTARTPARLLPQWEPQGVDMGWIWGGYHRLASNRPPHKSPAKSYLKNAPHVSSNTRTHARDPTPNPMREAPQGTNRAAPSDVSTTPGGRRIAKRGHPKRGLNFWEGS